MTTHNGFGISSYGIDNHGITTAAEVRWNWATEKLIEVALAEGAKLSKGGALCVMTGKHTGRAAKDKKIVKDSTTAELVDWGKVNVPMEPEHYDALRTDVVSATEGKVVYVMDVFAGWDERYRMPVRVITESPSHAHFVRTMFLEPTEADHKDFKPEFTIIHQPSLVANPEKHGTRDKTFIAVNFTSNETLIGGTWYHGEVKKSVFSALNFYLPQKGIMMMHASANVGREDNQSAVFFGLSGTGKTTLSADPKRNLIGDDEHGWADNGIFNVEGGCYAKVINLSREAEPEIWETTQRYGTLLENVVMDPETRVLDLFDNTHAENTRAAYPIEFIPNFQPDGKGPHPSDVVMLTADAFGVLPPIAKLSPEQAAYWFLLGYTAKVAGTEIGVTEPEATFSPCFGAPFMPLNPTVYAKLLAEKIEKHGARTWLINTGWTGGPYGEGSRMKIKYTRAMLNAALDGKLDNVGYQQDEIFGLSIPTSCPDVPADVLNPKSTWTDGERYDSVARDLAKRFVNTFSTFEPYVDASILAANPKI